MEIKARYSRDTPSLRSAMDRLSVSRHTVTVRSAPSATAAQHAAEAASTSTVYAFSARRFPAGTHQIASAPARGRSMDNSIIEEGLPWFCYDTLP